MNLKCILCHAVAAAVAFIMGTAHAAVPRVTLDVDETRTIYIDGPINQTMAFGFIDNIYRLDDGKQPILIIIASPGGNIMDGIDMIKAMQDAKSPITCVVDKYAASMAGFFAVACPKLLIHKYGILMFHEYSAQIQGERKEIKSRLQLVEALFDALMSEMSRKTGIPREFLDALVARDWWLNANDAEHAKLVSGIVDHYNITIRESAIDKFLNQLSRPFTPMRKNDE